MQIQHQWKAAAVVFSAVMAGVLTGCERKQVVLDQAEMNDSDTLQTLGTDENILNYTLPAVGEDIAVMQIRDYGDVKIRLFPEETETGVENFKLLVESGYYDELIFHRVIDDFMIQSGDPKGNGTGGRDAWNSESGFAQTISNRLAHVTGAVAYAVGEDKMNQSQFFIVTGETVQNELFQQLREYYGKAFTPAVEQLYQTMGGQPYLDGDYEIFGQVFDGLEYCLEIQKTEVDGNDKPKHAVVIEKAYITQYQGEEPHWLNAAGEEITGEAE
ncbi:MAG: peptidylprolyl isomerase [Oscillospiraceae bacterium]|nr:peptidylprolyl isomerase [Oscillospiraceae bacterium]